MPRAPRLRRLYGGTFAGAKDYPLYLSTTDCVPQNALDDLNRLGVSTVTLIGGDQVLTSNIAILKSCSPPVSPHGSALLDSMVSIRKISKSRDGQVFINVERLRDVPSEAGVRVAVLPPKASRSNAPLDSWYISGKAGGKETLLYSATPKIGILRVALTVNLPTLNEERNYLVVNAPDPFTVTQVMTPALVAANVIAAHVPGIALMFFPEARWVKAAGAALEGWTLFSDLDAAFSTESKGCPALQVGQVYETTETVNQQGDWVQVWTTTKVWSSQASRDQKSSPLCTMKINVTNYR